MKLFKSKTFWLSVSHLGLIGLGAVVAVSSGSPVPLVISSALNAALRSPVPARKPQPEFFPPQDNIGF